MRLQALAAVLAFTAVAGAGASSCSLATGTGSITGVLNVPSCWAGSFNLQPDFFAAVPYDSTLELRIQRGGDYETFSDGVDILIDDITTIRGDATQNIPSEYGEPLTVDLPAGVSPPGVPLTANPNPSNVHLSLYLQATCQIQNVALYAMESVTLNADGNCDPHADAGAPTVVCPGSTSGLAQPPASASPLADGGATSALDASSDTGAPGGGGLDASAESGAPATTAPEGHSTMTFTSLFDGNPAEVSAAARLTEGSFQVYLADPREMCPGGLGPPPPCRGSLTGTFKFYFQRGRPAQPFPY